MITLKKKLLVIAIHAHMNGNLRMHAHMFVGACVCAHVTSIKCFLTLKRIHYFIASLSRKITSQ